MNIPGTSPVSGLGYYNYLRFEFEWESFLKMSTIRPVHTRAHACIQELASAERGAKWLRGQAAGQGIDGMFDDTTEVESLIKNAQYRCLSNCVYMPNPRIQKSVS